jgi:hypothetical protein
LIPTERAQSCQNRGHILEDFITNVTTIPDRIPTELVEMAVDPQSDSTTTHGCKIFYLHAAKYLKDQTVRQIVGDGTPIIEINVYNCSYYFDKTGRRIQGLNAA